MSQTPIATIEELIEAVGSLSATARMLGMQNPQQLVSCRKAGRLPRKNAVPQRVKLCAAGYDAPWSLWGIDDAEMRASQPGEAA